MLLFEDNKSGSKGQGGKNGKSQKGEDDASSNGGKDQDENEGASGSSGGKDQNNEDGSLGSSGGKDQGDTNDVGEGTRFDDHSHWDKISEEDGYMQDAWRSHVLAAAEAVSRMAGDIPLGIERAIAEWQSPQTDWKTVLNDFVHQEVCDYSFSPPDRRFSESPFFLPDFNDTETVIEDVLFFVDTSGSISADMLTSAFSEIKGAIDQFDGKLRGHLGFFDAEVYPPVPFESVEELSKIRPKGGGGTSFEAIFRYVQKELSEMVLACIVILTDGYATFPDEREAMGVPVLWLINNDEIDPPWGKVTRIKEEKKKR